MTAKTSATNSRNQKPRVPLAAKLDSNSYLILIGQRLRQLRISRRWPLKRLAFELDVSIATISDWERGTRFPSGEHLIRVAFIFQQPVCQLMCAGKKHCPMASGCPRA